MFHLEDRAADEAAEDSEDGAEQQGEEEPDEEHHHAARAFHEGRDLLDHHGVDVGAARLDLLDDLLPVAHAEGGADEASEDAGHDAIDQTRKQSHRRAVAGAEGDAHLAALLGVEKGREKAGADDQRTARTVDPVDNGDRTRDPEGDARDQGWFEHRGGLVHRLLLVCAYPTESWVECAASPGWVFWRTISSRASPR